MILDETTLGDAQTRRDELGHAIRALRHAVSRTERSAYIRAHIQVVLVMAEDEARRLDYRIAEGIYHLGDIDDVAGTARRVIADIDRERAAGD